MVNFLLLIHYVALASCRKIITSKNAPSEIKMMFVGERQSGLYIFSSPSNVLKLGKIYTLKGYEGEFITRVSLKEVNGFFDPNWFKEL